VGLQEWRSLVPAIKPNRGYSVAYRDMRLFLDYTQHSTVDRDRASPEGGTHIGRIHVDDFGGFESYAVAAVRREVLTVISGKGVGGGCGKQRHSSTDVSCRNPKWNPKPCTGLAWLGRLYRRLGALLHMGRMPSRFPSAWQCWDSGWIEALRLEGVAERAQGCDSSARTRR
jgi:hypothetical protein